MKTIDELRLETDGNTRLLWHEAYWDGPHDGVMLWNGEKCWFSSDGDDKFVEIPPTEEEILEWKEICIKENWNFNPDDCIDYERYRYFKVYRIPEDAMKKIEEEHAIFEKYVGTHTSYGENGRRPQGKADGSHLRPYSEHHRYYNRTNKFCFRVDPEKHECIGEFEIS